MKFIHDDPEFADLLQIVAARTGINISLVEKDYWVAHTLWALQGSGLCLWFKGGTSLSKGFGLIQRFSEDLDLKIDPGSVAGLEPVASWTAESKSAVASRRAYFDGLLTKLDVPGASVVQGPPDDKKWRNGSFHVQFPQMHGVAHVLRPYVLLEVGNARVTPSIPRDMTSFVHEHLQSQGQLADYADNRPRGIRCVHPLVTLLEKLDALRRRVPKEDKEPAGFVRHFEDAAHIIQAEHSLPALADYANARALADAMLTERQLAALPTSHDLAFNPDDTTRWADIRAKHADIALMFWGDRISIEDACSAIRAWVDRSLAIP